MSKPAPAPFGNLRRGAYGLIMADPPWRFATRSPRGITPKGAGGQYSTMSLEEICKLPVQALAAPDCLLWLWATHPMLIDALYVMDRWGFRYVTSGVWSKKTSGGAQAFGTGYVLRCASEIFLIGKRGNPRTTRSQRTVIEAPIRQHSRKPDEAYAAAEAWAYQAEARADLFARERRAGWDSWGDEIEKFSR